MVGGLTAMAGGELLYDQIRKYLITQGYILPDKTGFQMAAGQLGFGGAENIDILSLRGPLGLPRSADLETLVPWMTGPFVGSIIESLGSAKKDSGLPGKMFKDVIGDWSPPLRAGIESYEEWQNAGVRSPSGHLQAQRPPIAVIIRGLDLSPSVASQRYRFRDEIVTAYESGHPEVASDLLSRARERGITFSAKDMRQIHGTAKSYLKATQRSFLQQMQ